MLAYSLLTHKDDSWLRAQRHLVHLQTALCLDFCYGFNIKISRKTSCVKTWLPGDGLVTGDCLTRTLTSSMHISIDEFLRSWLMLK